MIFYKLFLFLLFILAIQRIKLFRVHGLKSYDLPLAYLIKVGAGAIFLFVYSAHYGDNALSADAGAFIHESKLLNDVFWKSPSDYFSLLTSIGENREMIMQHLSDTRHWDIGPGSIINDSKNVIRVHSIIHFFSFGSALIHLLVFCMISLAGFTQLFLAFRPFLDRNTRILFWAVILAPSALFWSSGILKEPFLILGLGLFLRALMTSSGIRYRSFQLVIGFCLLLAFKPYVLLCLLPVLGIVVIYKIFPRLNWYGSLFTAGLIWVLSIFILPNQTQKVVDYISFKQYDFTNVAKGGIHAMIGNDYYYFRPDQYPLLEINGEETVSLKEPIDALFIKAGKVTPPTKVHLEPQGQTWDIYYVGEGCGSYIPVTPIHESLAQLLLNIPEALFNTWIRPLPTDPGSWLVIPAFLEGMAILLIILYAFTQRKQLSNLTQDKRMVILALTMFSLLLTLLIGWTTPVLGAIVRYRFPAQLAMIIASLIAINSLKLKSEK